MLLLLLQSTSRQHRKTTVRFYLFPILHICQHANTLVYIPDTARALQKALVCVTLSVSPFMIYDRKRIVLYNLMPYCPDISIGMIIFVIANLKK